MQQTFCMISFLMGVIGRALGSFLGGKIGKFAGRKLGHLTGMGEDKGEQTGKNVGEFLGNFVPFKKGGPVRKKTKAILHKGEYVLPAGVKPTRQQLAAVKRRHGRRK